VWGKPKIIPVSAPSRQSAVTIVLLAIMLATRFTRFLAQAAAGKLPREFLLEVVGLSSLQYLVILIPVSLLLGIMLALGRLYRDQEIAAMTGCGVGPLSLYRPFLVLSLSLAAMTAALAFQIGPWAGREGEYLLKDARRLIQYTPFEAGQFKEVVNGRGVFYTEHMDSVADTIDTVFARVSERGGTGPSIITAAHGTQGIDTQTGERLVTLERGYRYSGTPGRAQYDVVKFDRLSTRVAPPELLERTGKRALQETSALLGSDDPEDQAELSWRLAAPISVLLLALLAVPLAHTSPRSGRYGRVVLGIVLYLVYANLIALGQAWIAKGYTTPAIGLWWVHAMALGLGLVLIGRQLGWGRR